MTLQEIVDAARYSELHGVAMKDNNAAIITFINLGMLELYKRFPLKIKEYVVAVSTSNFFGKLPSDFMYALSAQDNSGQDGALQDIAINDPNSDVGISIPSYKELQIPYIEDRIRTIVSLVYVAKPPSYSISDLESELELPETLINCLLHYVGYKAHLGVKGDGQAENNAHWLRFDRSCKEARELGVAFPVDSWEMGDRINNRGFA